LIGDCAGRNVGDVVDIIGGAVVWVDRKREKGEEKKN